MSTIVLGSAKASPGVTTTAVALAAAWPRDRDLLLVEADPDGGVLAARHGLAAEPGLSTLAVSGRTTMSADTIAEHRQPLPNSDVGVLVCPPAAAHARRVVDLVAAPLAALLPILTSDLIADVGRLGPDSGVHPVVEAADALLLVARPRLEELQLLPSRLRALRRLNPRTAVLLVGDRPYPPAEVAAALGVEVIAVVADDPRGAAAITGHGRPTSLARSALMRSVRDAADSLHAWLPVGTTPTEDISGEYPAVDDPDPASAEVLR